MDYTDLYLRQLFTTLGQISASVLSVTVVVPVLSYYKRSLYALGKDD